MGGLRSTRSLVLGSAVVIGIACMAHAEPVGPEIGNKSKYSSAIRSVRAGQIDTDDFVGRLVAGEQLTVTVTADSRSFLFPTLRVIDPTGAERQVTVSIPNNGKKASVKNLVIDQTGAWTVRVAGAFAPGGTKETEGEYTVKFKVKSAKPIKLKKQTLGTGVVQDHVFGGIDGALLDLTLKASKSGSPVTLQALLDPAGNDVPSAAKASDDVTVNGTKITLKKLPLATGDGNYVARVASAGGPSTYDLTIKVVPQSRVKSGKNVALPAEEPFLDPVADPVRVAPNAQVKLTGANLAPPPESGGPLRVFFGADEVDPANIFIGGGGTELNVRAPAGDDGTTVDVTIRSSNGQGDSKDDYAYFAPPPTISALQETSGIPTIGDSTAGGKSIRIIGTGLAVQDTVFFGSKPVMPTQVSGTTAIVAPAPGGSPGPANITVQDEFGRTALPALSFIYKSPPSILAANAYLPILVPAGTDVTLTVFGSGFQPDDVCVFDGASVPTRYIDGGTLECDIPSRPTGSYNMGVRDRVGTLVAGPKVGVQDPPRIDSVTVISGPTLGPNEIPIVGGNTIRVVGDAFLPTDTVRLGGNAATKFNTSLTQFDFVAPTGVAGNATLEVETGSGFIVSSPDVVRYVGYEDGSATQRPAASALDDFSALRGAVGDLDGDGVNDDVVITSPDYYFNNIYLQVLRSGGGTRYTAGTGVANQPGTRATYTRLLFGDANGVLQDVTATRFPAASSDISGRDNWNGTAVAVGDLDGDTRPEIVLGGIHPNYAYYSDVRVLRGGVGGTFTDGYALAPQTSFVGEVTALGLRPYYAGYSFRVKQYATFTAARYVIGIPTAIALGDLDGDNDKDVVVGRDFHDRQYVFYDPSYISQYNYRGTVYDVFNFYYIGSYANYYPSNIQVMEGYYFSATKIFENDISGGAGRLVDVSDSDLPSIGGPASTLPAFHARDVALGDIDGVNGTDIVVTWDDPLTVTAYGRYTQAYYGTSYDTSRVATRVLLNNGAGRFTDQTTTWMPAASTPEFWQANQAELVDYDQDGDQDLVLLHEAGLTAGFTRLSLRVLRNDRPNTNRFVDVTTTVVPAIVAGSNDDLRGGALRVGDVNGDGFQDIVVGTREALRDSANTPIRSTRILFGSASGVFVLNSVFAPAPFTDSGQSDALLLGDLAGNQDPALILLTEIAPTNSQGSSKLRVWPWKR